MVERENATVDRNDELLAEEIAELGRQDDEQRDDDLAFEIFASRCPPSPTPF